MANHNIEVTNPDGETSLVLPKNVSREIAEDQLRKIGQPAKGWFYKVVNLKVKKARPAIIVVGIKIEEDEKKASLIDVRSANTLTNNGVYTVKHAKRDMRALGATHFVRTKVPNGKA